MGKADIIGADTRADTNGADTNGAVVVGIDLGGTNIKAGLFDTGGSLLKKISLPTQGSEGPEAVISRLGQAVAELQQDRAVGTLLGVGIGAPGSHDLSSGRVISWDNLGWRDVPLRAILEKRLKVPIYLDNDANAAALGEFWQGAGRGVRHMIMVTIGTGIGGGLILDGKLYRGAGGNAAEIGHMIIDPAGPQCNCGTAGHLEALTSAPWLVAKARQGLQQGTASSLANIADLEAKHIFAAAGQGDPLAVRLVEDNAHYLGMGIANLVNIFNPELVVLGGGVAAAGDLLLVPVRRQVASLALKVPAQQVRIVPAQLGNWAGSYGAAALVLQEVDYAAF